MAKKGISINAIFTFPARIANAMITTIDIAFSKLPKKNVPGISKSTPIAIVKKTKIGIAGSFIPKSAIILIVSGLFLKCDVSQACLKLSDTDTINNNNEIKFFIIIN